MQPLIQIIALLLFSMVAFFTIAAEEESAAVEEEPVVADQTEGSEPADSSTKQPAAHYYLPNIPDKRGKLLLDHMTLMGREDEVVSLNNAEEEFYGLYLPQANGQPQGGILILHDEQQHGHWPDIIGPLREYLPQFGWSTLTIELPDQLKRQRIPRPILDNVTPTDEPLAGDSESAGDEAALAQNSDDTNDEDINKEAKDSAGPESAEPAKIEDELTQTTEDEGEPALPRLDKLPDLPAIEPETLAQEEEVIDLIADYQAQNRQRINAAIDYLQQQNQFNLIVIGFGRGASWAVDYVHQQIQQEEEPKGLTLITIDALPNPYDKDLINQQLVDISLPYLDLLQSQTYAIDKTAAKRLAIMRRNGNPDYQQILTQEISSYHELENPTNRRIRGWIKSNAGGSLIAIKP